jgi:lipid A 3-O-deacylase
MKYFTLFLLFLLLVRCSDHEDSNSSSNRPGVKSRPLIPSEDTLEKKETVERSLNILPPGSVLISSKRIKKEDLLPEKGFEPETRPKIDSSMINKLVLLFKKDIEIDLREPGNLTYFLSTSENPDYSSMIILSHDRSIRINFDNDIFDNTDRYYTNGIRFDFISPTLKQAPFSWLMIPYWGHGINYYGLSIGQNMYTPYTTKTGGIHYGDRPYSAYLVLGNFKISNDPYKNFRQTTEIDIGVIGPYSFGDFVQKSFHQNVPTNNEPLGWEYQIQNDLVLNYHLSYEKGIINRHRIDLILKANSALGTLYTNVSGGFQFRAGRMNPYFSSYGFSNMKINKTRGDSKFQAYVFLTSIGKLVGYDATLEGGLFNRTSLYTLKPDNLSLVTYQGTFGITIAYEGIRLDVEQFLLSPEFSRCAWHKWVHIGLTFGI